MSDQGKWRLMLTCFWVGILAVIGRVLWAVHIGMSHVAAALGAR